MPPKQPARRAVGADQLGAAPSREAHLVGESAARRPHPRRHQTRRPPDRASVAVRADRQSQDRDLGITIPETILVRADEVIE
jgi:hypothetical protein